MTIPGAKVTVPTTLNSAGCDEAQFDAMHIVAPDFLEHNHEIVEAYARLGVRPTQSCIPYELNDVVTEGGCVGGVECDLFWQFVLRADNQSGVGFVGVGVCVDWLYAALRLAGRGDSAEYSRSGFGRK